MKTLFFKLKNTAKDVLQRVYITLQLYRENGLANHAAACAYGFLLSMAPMLLLLAFFIILVYESSPGAITAMINTIPFLGGIFDEQWLSSDFFYFSRPGIPSIISVLSIIWAGRILALSMQRGLRIVFPADKNRNAAKNAFVTLAIEASVIIFVLVVIISSRTAMRFYELLDFLPERSIIKFVTSYFGGQVSSIFLLGVSAFLVYLFVPEKSPRKFSAFQGAVFCTLAYFCTVMVLGVILNNVRYNFIYGTFGNLVIILINVYFFFTFFFIGAQFAFVTDAFEALLFSMLRKIKIKALEKETKRKIRPFNLWSRLFNTPEDRLDKYMRYYKKSEIIFCHEDAAGNIFYLLEGEVEIIVSSSDGSENSAGILKADSFFGEIGYMLSENQITIIRAITDVSVFVMPPALFDTVLKYDTNLDKTLIEHMSKRLNKQMGYFQ